MIDALIHPKVMELLQPAVIRTKQSGLSPRTLILFGFLSSIATMLCAAMQLYPASLLLLIIARAMRTLAIALSGVEGLTKKDSYIDAVCDFSFYGGFVFLFGLGVNGSGTAAAFLLFSYLLMAIAFFAGTAFDGQKKFEIPQGGLIERTEMFVFMILCCFYPALFPALCAVFGLLCVTSSFMRVFKTLKT